MLTGRPMSRLDDLKQFYRLLAQLEKSVGGMRVLSKCHGRMKWSGRGVYFFFEEGQTRSHSGEGLRIVRVGTHAIDKPTSKSTLWGRLRSHRGNANNGGGNHRGSIFRLLVGQALYSQRGMNSNTWGRGSDLKKAASITGISSPQIEISESPMEIDVCRKIGAMQFLWLKVDDAPGPKSDRAYLESNSIALLSNYQRDGIDPIAQGWLGSYSDRPKVQQSGLWNSDYVEKAHATEFLKRLESRIAAV